MTSNDSTQRSAFDDPVYRTGVVELLGVLAYGEISACERLGRQKGYALVGCSLNGVNAFFVREDLCRDLFDAPFTAAHHYEPIRYFLNRRAGFPRAAG